MWYATRASGYTALVLLSATVVIGSVTSVRRSSRNWPRFLVQSVHRNLSLLVVVFLIIHIATSALDPFAKLNLADAVVPFVATYRPLWLGLGVVACELLVAIMITSLLRGRLGWRAWRAVHLLASVSWPIAVVHGVGTGTDTKSIWALLLVTACAVVVVAALVWRLSVGGPGRALVRMAGMAACLTGVCAFMVWLVAGPLQPGWAKAAGTPKDLLAGAAVQRSPVVSGLAAGLDVQLTGTIVQSPTAVTATLTDIRDATLRVVIVAKADGSGSLTVSRSGSALCAGAAVIGTTRVTGGCGSVRVTIDLAGQGGALSGTMSTQQAGQ
jgi:sulfoxide reductase heme-binding subunit YedZ